MGGIGKTELAVQYALKHLQSQTYPGGVCWLNARVDVGTEIVDFARTTLDLTLPELPDLIRQVAWCWGQFPSADCLIVFDDVQDYAEIAPFLPPAKSRFKVLMTTRSQPLANVESLKIEVLSEALALELLRSLVTDGRIDQDLDQAKELCQWLGCLPLGLELVGRYLARKKDVSLAKLWQRLQDKKLEAKALLEAEPGMTATLGVTAAFELSWQELNEEAQQLAALLSLFALAEIPWTLVQGCLPDWDEEDLEDLRDEKLVDLSLLNRVGEGMYELHQLLREFFAVKREQMAEVGEWKRSFCKMMVEVAEQIPQMMTLEAMKRFTPAIPHLKEAATTFNPWLTDKDLIEPSNRIAWFYEEQSAFEEAKEWYLHSRRIVIERLGDNHPDVATSLNNLALMYRSQGQYAEVEPLLLQALEIWQQKLGDNHLYVATCRSNLALLYKSQGRYGDAEPLYLQALEAKQQQLGQNHSAVATILNNLAGLYKSQERYGDAESLYLQALEIRQRRLGQDHPSVAASLNNLAVLYELQGRYVSAESYYLQAMRISKRTLGDDHQDVAIRLNNLAGLYVILGRYAEAEMFFLQSIAIFYQQLGETHLKAQTVWQRFRAFLWQVLQSDRSAELSNHSMTRSLLQDLQAESDHTIDLQQ
jgi:tetratricopeptide (TPR) repeat protein